MRLRSAAIATVSIWAVLVPGSLFAQLFENLEGFGRRLDVGDPETVSEWGREGPKGIASDDFDGNGRADFATSNLDGTVTVYLNKGDGRFHAPLHLATGSKTLRGIDTADFNGDGAIDIATAAPLEGRVHIFDGDGQGAFESSRVLSTWEFARDLTAGDFDGDGTTDLLVAGGGHRGAVQFRGTGDGQFEGVAQLNELVSNGYTRPVYSFATYRRDGDMRDSVAVTSVWHLLTFLYEPDDNGELELSGAVSTTRGVYDLEIGTITNPAESGQLDLLSASRDTGLLQVFHTETGDLADARIRQVVPVPGGLRDARIVDVDGDGWNDVVVVLRCFDRVITYENQEGTLVPVTELPVGRSPRQLAAADYNVDGLVDFAVINRISSDVNILHAFPGKAAFGASDQIYAVDGGVTDLQVIDANGDGRDDVIQLHRASSDLTIRYTSEDGSLGSPVYLPVAALPSAERVIDVNSDGLPDLVVASLGRNEGDGSINVLLGQSSGEFSEPTSVSPPTEVGGRLFGVEVADFDGDGTPDIAAGFFDCRLAFFRGVGDGTFEFAAVHFFAYESRALVSGDFDGDGDIDLAGGSRTGLVVVVENTGKLLTTAELTRTDYEPTTSGKFGTRDMTATDVNSDGDLDLIVSSGKGVMLFVGGDGMSFSRKHDALPGTNFPASSVTTGDFDGDGETDVAVACRVLSCIVILTRNDEGDFVPALSVDVPSGHFLAAGDLDGDGHADLVGSGGALWTALSSRESSIVAVDSVVEEPRPRAPGPVINEILASNNQIELEFDSNKRPDWIELYNGADEDVSLAGWRLVRVKLSDPDNDPPAIFNFPDSATMKGRGHLVVVCSKTLRSDLHTGFRLSGRQGAIVSLFNAENEEVDRVHFPPQRPNISYARYEDGSAGFTFNNYPNPLEANVDNGPVPPIVRLESVHSRVGGQVVPPTPGAPIRFVARGEDDEGIVSIRVFYERIDGPAQGQRSFILYDDGMHDDGGMQDGIYAGESDVTFPAGAAIRYRLVVEDLGDNVTIFPDSDAPSGASGMVGYYTLAIGDSTESTLQISEIVPRNDSGLEDEHAGRPDWVEIRNCGDEPVSLDGIHLGPAFPASDDWYSFPRGLTLAPGEHKIVYCDGNRVEGELHAPFKLEPAAGRIALIGTNPLGAHVLLDTVEYENIAIDEAYARIGCDGEWVRTMPSPGAENHYLPGDLSGDRRVNLIDPVGILSLLFGGAANPACPAAGDANADASLDLSDAIYLLNYLFGGGPAPVNRPRSCTL